MENLGSLAVLLAFCLAIYAVIGSVIGRIKRNAFLILSGEPISKSDLKALGADGAVLKPFDIRELIAQLRSFAPAAQTA